MKLLIATILLGSTMATVHGQDKIIIKGKVSGDTKGFNKVFTYTATRTRDSAIIKDGTYTIVLPYTGPALQLFYDEYDVRSNGMYSPYGVLIDKPGIYYIDTDISKGFKSSKVRGGETPELYQEYTERESAAFQEVTRTLEQQYGKAWLPENDPNYQSLDKSRDSLQQAYIIPLITSFVKKNRNSFVSAFVLGGYARKMMSLADLEKCYSLLSPTVKRTVDAQKVANYIQGLKHSTIGNYVNNFAVADAQGKKLEFNSLKGKYVVIDFWASWCGPCRASFPHLREVYKTFKDDKFEILSISIDKDKSAWHKALAEENNPWPQTLDDNAVADKYFAITGVPTTYLIDPEGKILLKEVGFESDKKGKMELKLEELFGRSVPVSAAKPKKKGPAKIMRLKSIQ